jgi:hypothetical protein
VKYAEQVRENSKSATSVMFCGSATGVFLPPYVVYKSNNVYDSWMKGGPKGTRYSATPSGWFDSFTFADFMAKLFIPHVRRQVGRKLMLCDNLSCHMSADVIDLCRKENVEFVCLPPNSTDKMQPLDVGVFGPMKGAWRKQLHKYSDQDPTAKLLLKPAFPTMLKELVSAINTKEHLPKARVLKIQKQKF